VQTTAGAALTGIRGDNELVPESLPEPAEDATAQPSDQEPVAVAALPGVARAHRRIVLVLALAAFVVALDQISKALVAAKLGGHDPVRLAGGAIYLLEERNRGAAFNLAEGLTIVLTVIAAAVVVVVVRVASRLGSTSWAVALGLILGGAAGNLSDRLFRAPGPLRGAVVDWISLFDPEGRVWPVFNLADSAIVCGGAIAVVLMLLGRDLTVRRP
jgi:signal peptidase II